MGTSGVKTRYKLPEWLWWLAMPFVAFAAFYIAPILVKLALSPFHLEPAADRFPSALELYLSSFLIAFLAGFGWSFFAPFRRFAAAIWMAAIMTAPCLFCLSFGGEGPPVEVARRQLCWMIGGYVAPIVIYLILDRKEIINAWKERRQP